ncbi:Hint domain-containing protein [Litoreibacter ponti]|uniref:Hint domain-containing protein n=1 Tax=Litoreibacter ponti TaxID=1510457 RepID=UPI001304A1B2|nr:Hint domain-containing protein [Litoreibacter ponti]
MANLGGVRFDQIYGDNSGGPEFDTDGDGTATQEDEFVSISNDSGGPMDISGWQIWSDASGVGAPDLPQDGLYHTFPPGTVLAPGETLYIINEITGPVPSWAQEASEGGVESGAGDESTNFLSEGSPDDASESVALVDPSTGDFIVFNMSPIPSDWTNEPGFPGTTLVGEVDGAAVQEDQNAGSSYRYNSTSESYEYSATSVPCVVRGTLIVTPGGPVPVETLRPGDMIATLDAGAMPVLWIGHHRVDINAPGRRHLAPVRIGGAMPALLLSPQHRLLTRSGHLAPAKGLLRMRGVRRERADRIVSYYHLLLERHCIIFANGLAVESLLLGGTHLASCSMSLKLALDRLKLRPTPPARPCLTVAETRRAAERDAHFLARHDCPSRAASLIPS